MRFHHFEAENNFIENSHESALIYLYYFTYLSSHMSCKARKGLLSHFLRNELNLFINTIPKLFNCVSIAIGSVCSSIMFCPPQGLGRNSPNLVIGIIIWQEEQCHFDPTSVGGQSVNFQNIQFRAHFKTFFDEPL